MGAPVPPCPRDAPQSISRETKKETQEERDRNRETYVLTTGIILESTPGDRCPFWGHLSPPVPGTLRETRRETIRETTCNGFQKDYGD